MTLLSPPYALGADGQVLSGKLLRHSLGCTWRPASGALRAASGVVQGPAGSMMELSLINPTTLRVNPGVAVIQGTQAADQGQYVAPNDGQVNLTVTGQTSQFRRSLVVVEVDDSQAAAVASTPDTDRALLHIIDGALSSTAPGVLPALPANSLALGEIAIPPTGQSVTLTPYNPRTTGRGGVQAVFDDTSTVPGHGGEPGVYVDQLRMRNGRLERWDGSAWVWPRAAQGMLGARYFDTTVILSNAAVLLPAFDIVNITLPSARQVRQTIQGLLSVDTLGTSYGLLMQSNGINRSRAQVEPPAAGRPVSFQRSHWYTLSAGTHSFAVTGGRMAGTGVSTLVANPEFEGPWQHTVEDMGAV